MSTRPRRAAIRWRRSTGTTSSSTSETPNRRPTTTCRRSASIRSPTRVRKRACAIASATSSQQNKLRFVLTASLVPDDEIARHVALHGDGIKDIAILVEDANAAFEMAVARRRARRAATDSSRGRDRPHPARDDRHLRRYRAFVHPARRLSRHLRARLRRGAQEHRRRAEARTARSSTTASATSAGARWTRGAISTRASSASRSSSRSTTRISRLSTRRCARK